VKEPVSERDEQDWETLKRMCVGLESWDGGSLVRRLRREMEELRGVIATTYEDLTKERGRLAECVKRKAKLAKERDALESENTRLREDRTELLERMHEIANSVPEAGIHIGFEQVKAWGEYMRRVARSAINNTGGEDQ
jgi:hypothetical protein